MQSAISYAGYGTPVGNQQGSVVSGVVIDAHALTKGNPHAAAVASSRADTSAENSLKSGGLIVAFTNSSIWDRMSPSRPSTWPTVRRWRASSQAIVRSG